MNNILLTGKPGCGKTTLVLKVIDNLGLNAYGFYTKEKRENGKRIGFELYSLINGSVVNTGILAHQHIKSSMRVGKYGVNLKVLDEMGIPAIEEGIKSKNFIVIDEIGKMELFSDRFKNILIKALEVNCSVLATIMERAHHIADQIKSRDDVKLIRVENTNCEKLSRLIKER